MSQMKAKVDHNKITQFLTNILILGDVIEVDKNNQIHYKSSPTDPILISPKEGIPAMPLYVYSMNTTDPNALIWNPLVETTSSGSERLWGYNTISVILAKWVQHIQEDFLTRCVEQKNNSGSIEPSLVPILSKFIDRVDAKMLEEFEHIKKSSSIKEYFNIYFNRLKKKSTILVGFEDESNDYYKSFPKGKIRKKSWELFLEMIKVILGVDNDSTIKEVYTYSTSKVEHPQFETFIHVWLKAWKAIKPYMVYFDTIEDYEELITSIEKELSMALVYRECTMWLSQSSAALDPKKMVIPSSNNENKVIEAPKVESSTSSWKTMGNNNFNNNPANKLVTRVSGNYGTGYNGYNNNYNYNTNNNNQNGGYTGEQSWKNLGSTVNNMGNSYQSPMNNGYFYR